MTLDNNKVKEEPIAYTEWNEMATAVNKIIDGTLEYTDISGFQTAVESYSINNIVEDLTPQLGGELDAQANSIGFTLQSLSSYLGETTVDWSEGNHANITLSENTEFFFTAPSKTQVMTLLITQGTTDYTVALPTITWLGDTPTIKTGSGAVTMIVLRYDGTNYVGDWK